MLDAIPEQGRESRSSDLWRLRSRTKRKISYGFKRVENQQGSQKSDMEPKGVTVSVGRKRNERKKRNVGEGREDDDDDDDNNNEFGC